jgi:AcrR family transcriptional regulator
MPLATIEHMSRPPAARETVLDAFERILVHDGERAATLDATAKAAGVSKGGLLYHFASKEALVAGLIARLEALTDDDIEAIDRAGDGAISYFVRSSVAVQHPLDRAVVATARLAQGGNAAAERAIRIVRRRWLEAVGKHVTDPTVALAITLIGDGLYYASVLHGDDEQFGVDAPTTAQMDALVALLERLAVEPPPAPTR